MNKRKEEERRILAELDEAVAKEKAARGEVEEEKGEEKIYHCPRCRSEMKKGACPNCGHTIYIEMSEKKRRMIKWSITAVLLGVFAVIFLISKLQ